MRFPSATRPLDARLKSLAGRERDATFEIVVHLSELYGRKRHLGEGPGTLYVYCRDVLHLSEDAAYNRAAAARAVRRFPIILDGLADGSLNVTTVKLLRKVLTPENHLAVLAEAKHRSNREVKVIVARLAPQPDVPSSIRKLPALRMTVPPPVVSPPVEEFAPVAPPPVSVPPPPVRRPVVAPLTPERYRVEFTVPKETHDRLRRVQDLLRRAIPDGDPAAIFARALILLEREAEKELTAATTRPRPARGTAAGSRHIPAEVRRGVWRRDGGQELHHVKPFAVGGEATVENISLRCRAHNAYEGELVFGRYDPSVVRETPEKYAVSGEIPPVPERVPGCRVRGKNPEMELEDVAEGIAPPVVLLTEVARRASWGVSFVTRPDDAAIADILRLRYARKIRKARHELRAR